MNDIIWKIKRFDQLSVDELYKILKNRVDVFVVEQNCPYPDLDGFDQKALHLWAEIEGQLVTYCRIFDRDIKYSEASIGRVLTTRHARRNKWGSLLLEMALGIIETRYQTTNVKISAQDYLIRFYQNLGFEDTGKKYLEDGIPHTEMTKGNNKNTSIL